MITLKQIAQCIEPKWDLKAWFNWPPNVFALVSIVLQRTGSYKIALMSDAYWQDGLYKDSIHNDSDVWASAVSQSIVSGANFDMANLNTQMLVAQYEVLKKNWDKDRPVNSVDLNKLRSFDLYNPKSNDVTLQKYAIALANILAVADASCAGVGMISNYVSPTEASNLPFKLYANILLNATGSLSTVFKFHGTVLPKMRTPQSGIVLRSMSHHLTFHQTEVEVVWRIFPWAESKRQSLNVMVVPLPFEIHQTDFEIVELHHDHTKYFKVKAKDTVDEEIMDSIVSEVCRKAATNSDIDILVFPEMSLSKLQYNYLLRSLEQNRKEIVQFRPKDHNGLIACKKLPIIIAGVLSDESSESEVMPMDNQIRLAIYFHGSWYDISQLKHHRWQLDRSQITQYGLEGHLSTEHKWTEYCSILQRRLTVLCPNDWLSITALICEDLARQEPVGEVIRGIGPTILTALLSDGPQIKERWSARYASVLADDPGTSVLSVTSKGMAERSRKSDGMTDKGKELTIGLWKDLVKSWDLLKLESDHDALMFTISSKFVEEHTLDGRDDSGAASVFKMDSIVAEQIKLNRGEKSTEASSNIEGLSTLKSWLDLRTLSTWTFIVDVLVDLYCLSKPERNELHWLELLFKEKAPDYSYNVRKAVLNRIINAWNNPNLNGTSLTLDFDSNTRQIERNENAEMLRAVKQFMAQIAKDQNGSQKTFLDIALNYAGKQLKSKNANPQLNLLIVIFLHNLNGKLSDIVKCDASKSTSKHFNPFQQTADFAKRIKNLLDEFDNQLTNLFKSFDNSANQLANTDRTA